MNITVWKPISLCAALIFDKRRKKDEGRPNVVEPTVLRRMQERKVQEAMEEASEQGSLHKSQMLAVDDVPPMQRSRSLARLNAQRDFLKATAQVAGVILHTEQGIPALEEAYDRFKAMYPMFQVTESLGELRHEEYGHLDSNGKVCLDYCGFGLFSYLQHSQQWESCSFGLCPISVNLSSHAAHGGAEEGTAEGDIRVRIMEYLNIPASEYRMVFTASRGSAFKLLAEAYPFHQNRRMLSMYDYESESVNWMGQIAREKGAQVWSAWFGWPTLRVCSSRLRKQLKQRKGRKRDSAVGLFVFPVQSRVTGAEYSYQWMSMAQRSGWHVLLDAGALGPKDMDSLGLSLFRPEFIIASFYKVFGLDPTGFGCLFIKNSVMGVLENQGGAPAVGMVRIVPVLPRYLSDSGGSTAEDENGSERSSGGGGEDGEFQPRGFQFTAFSGPFSSLQVRGVLEGEIGYGCCRNGASPSFEDTEDAASSGEVMKSPLFSEDEDEDDKLFCIDVGQSPVASQNSDPWNVTSLRKSNLGQVERPDGFSRRTSHRQLFAASVNDEEEQDSGAMALDSSGCSSPKPDGSDGLAWRSGGERHSPLKRAEADPSFLDQSTDVKTPEVGSLDPGEAPARVEEKVHTDPNCSPTNVVNGVLHGSCGGSILVSTGGAASSGITGSRRFPKLNKITFMLENLDPVSKGNAEADRNISHVHEPDKFLTREVTQSTCFEITSCDEDTEQYIPCAAEYGCIANGLLENGSAEPGNYRLFVGNKQNLAGDGGPKLCKAKENAIRRETEGEFMLLGRREVGRFLDLEEVDRISSMRNRLSFSTEEDADMESDFLQGEEESGVASRQDDETASDSEVAEEQEWTRREPRIICKHLDHVDSMGLNKTTSRLRYLINWLITSLLQLRHPGPNGGIALVHIYGPKIRYDRGGAVAFNLYDCNGVLVSPELVQSRAEEDNIALGLAFLSHLLMENNAKLHEGKSSSLQVEVVTASLGFLSNFEDIYRLWAFLAKFLDEDFVKAGGCQYESGSSQGEATVAWTQ